MVSGTHAGRLGQSDQYGRMNEPRSNCSERPYLRAGWLQWTDPRTGAHQTGSFRTVRYMATLFGSFSDVLCMCSLTMRD